MDPSDRLYPSVESRVDVFTTVAGLVSISVVFFLGRVPWILALAVIALGAWSIWRAARNWRQPYACLNHRRLAIFERGRTRHHLEVSAIAGVCRTLNGTIISMQDGTEISVSHMKFASRDDARDFHDRLANMIRSAGNTSNASTGNGTRNA